MSKFRPPQVQDRQHLGSGPYIVPRGWPSHRAGPDRGKARWDVLEFLAR